jgi:MFS family permease
MAPAIRFDRRFLALGALVAAVALAVPAAFRNAVLAIAIAMWVLAPMPRGTRGLTFAVMIGLATGIASINLFAVGIFQLPITHEFGWSQAKYTLVTPLSTVVTVVSSLAIGRLFDRRGVRQFALGCTALLGATLISLYWLTPSALHLYGVFCLIPLIGAGTSSIAYSRVVARWFAARRGQAFGAALAGIGIGGAVLSALSQYLIGRVGWRGAYVGLGLLLLCVTLPVLYVWLHDAPEDVGLGPDGAALDASSRAEPGATPSVSSRQVGFTAGETRRLRRFWMMLLAFLVLAIGIGGVMLQLVPILRARGITPERAAAIQGALGLALIVGRAFAGFLMDRMFAPYVAAVIILLPMTGAAMLAGGAVGGPALLAAVFLGLAAGAELDVIAFLITRYFGTRAYAENYGWQYAAWTLGSGTAPLLTAMSFDRLGTHTPILWAYVVLFAISAVLIARLGPYPRLPAASAP